MRDNTANDNRAPRRRTLRLVGALVAVATATLAACSSQSPVVVTVTTTPGQAAVVTVPATSSADAAAGSSGSPSAPPSSTAPTSTAPAMRVSATPAFGSTDLAPTAAITVTLFSAKIQTMTLTGDDGTVIDGTIADDKGSWTLGERLKYGTTYTLNGTALVKDGSTQPITGTYATIKPADTIRASIQIPTGATVGIAAPIIITFASPVTDRAAAEKTFKVTTDKGEIQGSWGWLQDEDIQGTGTKQSIVHWRPAEYWPGNTKVHVEADLYGVNYGSGWGREDISSDFTIGRALIATGDVNTHRLVVQVDDKIIRNYPVAYGAEADPGKATVSGIHVVTDKYLEYKMTNPEYGYYNVPEAWAVRINNNGEFIHENKAVEKAGLLGKANVSHGCVNMSGADAKDFYDMAIYGDPVIITNTGVPMTPKDSIFDWIYTFDQWKTFSAL